MTMTTNVVIASIARTPIARFRGSLSSLKGSELGSVAVRGALDRLGGGGGAAVGGEDFPVREAYLGNVVSAGMGQAPARQAVLGAGLPLETICTTVRSR